MVRKSLWATRRVEIVHSGFLTYRYLIAGSEVVTRKVVSRAMKTDPLKKETRT